MATIYRNSYSDNSYYDGFSEYEHHCHSSPKPRIFHNLALVLEQGGSYLDQNTRHAINFVLKHYNKLQEKSPNVIQQEQLAFSPNYNLTFMGLNLKSECKDHIQHLTRDLNSRKDAKDITKLRQNLVNLLNQIYHTL